MRVGELAKTAGVSVRVIRHYEAKGLIQSVRAHNGYREYRPGAVETVGHIRLMLDCGFSTRQIYGFLPCFGDGKKFDSANCAAGLQQYLAKRDELDRTIVLLQQRRNHLSDQIAHFGDTPSKTLSRNEKENK
jgi:MerR family copper efflux transcriptional regulator